MPGYQASDSENAYDFFFRFFFFFNPTDRPTDPISGNAFDGKQEKKKGMALSLTSKRKIWHWVDGK